MALIFGLCVTLLGCDKKAEWQDPGPEEVFRTFLMDWFRGERKAAFSTIVEADRAALIAPLEELKASGSSDAVPEDYEMLVVGRVNNPYDFKSIELAQPLRSAPQSGQKVELRLNFHDGHQGSATMVWTGEQWRVDLPIRTGEKGAPNGAPSQSPSERPQNSPDAQSVTPTPDSGTPDSNRDNSNHPKPPSKTP